MKIKKTIAAVAAAAMVFTSVPMVAFAAACENTPVYATVAGEYKHTATCDNDECETHDGTTKEACAAAATAEYGKSNEAHWKLCEKCGGEVDSTFAKHSYTVKGTGDDAGFMKCVCGAKQACTHPTWGAGDTAGKKKCSTCDYETDCTHANATWAKDSSYHKKTCSDCGTAVDSHLGNNMKTVSVSDSQHQSKCAVAGCTVSETAASHGSFTYTDKGAKHEVACPDCDYKATVDHTVTTWADQDDGTHKGTCTASGCGAEVTEAHSFAWDPTADSGNGAVVCEASGCTAEDDEHEHAYTGWTLNSTKHVEVCDCGKEGTKQHTASETLSDEYSSNATQHWHECTIAGCTVTDTKENHVYDDDDDADCNTCGYERDLSSGTVTPPPADVVTPDDTNNSGSGSSSSSSSSSSSGSAASGTAGTVTTVASASDMRTANNTNVNIKASETKVTPAIVNAFVKNKKTKTMTITYSNKLRVAVSKSDIKGTPALDFSVSGNKFLSSKLLNSSALAKAKTVVQIDFVNKGKIDGIDKVTVQSRVGGKYAGEKATVYEYSNGKLVKVATAKVGGSGLVSFKVDHLGQYVVVVG